MDDQDRYGMLIMDQKLAEAALSADVRYLNNEIAKCENKQDYSPLLAHHYYYCTKRGKRIGGNIFHLAVWEKCNDFIKEAIKILPPNIIDTLVSQQLRAAENSVDIEFGGWNPLHVAATVGSRIIIVILKFYKSNNNNPDATPTHGKPWLAQTSENHLTPLHLALKNGHDYHGELILEMDMKLFSNMVDNSGRSVLYLAIENNCMFVADKILSSSYPYSLEGPGGKTPLHVLSHCDPNFFGGELCKNMLKLHPKLIKAVDNIGQMTLHSWCEIGSIWPLEYGLKCEEISAETKRNLFELLTTTDPHHGNNPFHIVAANGTSPSFHKIGAKLATVYIEQGKKLKVTSMDCDPPWLTTKNNSGLTPVDLALGKDPTNKDEGEQEARTIIYCVLRGEYVQLFELVSKGSYELATRVLDVTTGFGCFYNPPSSKSLLLEAGECSDKVGTWILKKYRDTHDKLDDDTQIIMALSEKALKNGFTEMMSALQEGMAG